MSDFFEWARSLATGQLLLEGKHRHVVRELLTRWDTHRMLSALAPHREELKRITKRAQRAMAAWRNKLGRSLQGVEGREHDLDVERRVTVLMSTIEEWCKDALCFPPNVPLPHDCRRLYLELCKGFPRDVRGAIAAALRGLPTVMHDLAREQRRNPWLSAHVIGLFLDNPRQPLVLQPWLELWAAKHRAVHSIGAATDWIRWRAGKQRTAPEVALALICSHLGVLADGYVDVPTTSIGSWAPLAAGSGGSTTKVAAAEPSLVKRLTLKEAAARYNVKLWTLREAVRSGDLPCARDTAAPNATIYLRSVDVELWLASDVGKRQHAPRNSNFSAERMSSKP